MCKELKVLIDLSNDMHLSKRVRDSLLWAIQNLSPEQAETETSFGGWDFQSWPSIPDKKIFEELIKSRRAKKGVIMTNSYIEDAAVHLHELVKGNVTVNQAIKIAAKHGWVGFKAKWITNDIGQQEQIQDAKPTNPADALRMINDGQIKDFNKLDRNVKAFIESQYRFGNYNDEIKSNLERIGLVL
jgi:hypothetical protein